MRKRRLEQKERKVNVKGMTVRVYGRLENKRGGVYIFFTATIPE